jgi:putative acetyltransferase
MNLMWSGKMLIRKFIETDLEQILHLFYNTIHAINAKDYSESQLDAWGVKNPDKDRWLKSLIHNITFIAEIKGKIVGFGDLNNKRYVDRLYTHKDYQGIGIASKILYTLEKEAIKLGHTELYTEASITAMPFFENRGYKILQSQNKQHNGQVFVNFIMKKEHFSS